MEYMITLVVFLSEFLLVLLLATGFLLYRLAKLKKRMANEPNDDNAADMAKGHPLLDYLSIEIKRTNQKISQLSDDKDQELLGSLEKRADFLKQEKDLLEQFQDDNDTHNYWSSILSRYPSEVTEDKPASTDTAHEKTGEDESAGKLLKLYKTRIDNLEKFKSMFMEREHDLSSQTELMSNLTHFFIEAVTSENPARLDQHIQAIKAQRSAVLSATRISPDEFDELIEGLYQIHQTSQAQETSSLAASELAQRLEETRDEKEFLVKQIEHLLAQEVEASKDITDELEALKSKVAHSDLIVNETYKPLLSALVSNDQGMIADCLSRLQKYRHELAEQLSFDKSALDALIDHLASFHELLQQADEPQSAAGQAAAENPDIAHLQEENEFLVKQIEHLLAQEVASSNDLQEKIRKLENRLADKEGVVKNTLRPVLDAIIADDTDKIDDYLAAIRARKQNLVTEAGLSEQDVELILARLGSLNAAGTDSNSANIDTLKSENEFLVQQIEHLLAQEVEASKKLLDRIHTLEDEIIQKDKEIQSLKQ